MVLSMVFYWHGRGEAPWASPFDTKKPQGVQQVEVRGRDDLDLIAHFLMGWYRKNITRIQEKGGEWEENTNMGH